MSFPLKLVNHVFYFLSPLSGGFAVVEGLTGDWFSEGDGVFFTPLLKHLIGQKEHLKAEFNADKFSEVRKPVKEVGVSSAHMNGYDVSLEFNRFLDKVFVPFKVANNPPLPSGCQSGWKYQDLLIRFISSIDLIDRASLVSEFIYRDE